MFWWLLKRGIDDWFEAIMLVEVAACLAGMATACVVQLPARARTYWPIAAVLGVSAICLSSMALLGVMAFGRRVDATFLNALHLVWSYVAPSLVAFHFILRAQEIGMTAAKQATE
ncbi:hypothetical protein [Pseudoxanthomonas sp. PXM02]|uniref:hypothetical protein n=1 Tax=Pseudoxanthomonas sp. PXM02 TaxID=2769294 RepID=UPI00177B2056|nr:hypothetical protein [Pseudoxanthomonas sp. PXM02]MBD9480980.1 hypothetical protein [Pseudoxanthomonas sp. PXM02]